MNKKLLKLADFILASDIESANNIYKLAGRHDKVVLRQPIKMQPAYKYIMYLKCMHNLDDSIFHKMKRKYLDTSSHLQGECQKELDKIIIRDALNQKIPSSTIRRNFYDKLKNIESDQDLWNSYFKRKIGKR